MPRGSSDFSDAPVETPAGLREMAARARRLARGVLDRQTIEALSGFARELEARAASLETAPKIFTHDAAAAVQRIEDDADSGDKPAAPGQPDGPQ